MQKSLTFPGFNGPSTCRYSIGELDGKPIVIFIQGSLATTSITNAIETIVSVVLATDLATVDPSKIRFFEYYPPALQAPRTWQEVTFAEVTPLDPPAKSLVSKLVRMVTGRTTPVSWAVDKPDWRWIRDSEVPVEILKLVR